MNVSSLNAADWVILAIIAFSVLTAAMQGFLFEAISLAGLVLGYLLAAWEYHVVANWLAPYVKAQSVADIIGFIVILLAVTILATAHGCM